ncbi:MAG: sensor histidine kinase [Actinomycetota bacterium]
MTSARARPLVLAAIGVAAVALAVVMRVTVQLPLDAIAEGLAFAGAGIAAWARRPENRTGKLMVAYTFMVWTIHLQNTRIPVLWTLPSILFPAAIFGVLLYLILAFPQGRLRGRIDRILFAVAAGNVLWQIAISLFFDPRAVGCLDCPPGLNLLLVRSDIDLVIAMAKVNPWWLSLVMFPMIALLVARFVRASRPGRRVLGPMLIPAVVFLLANRVYGLSQALAADPLAPQPQWVEMLANVEQAAVIILPLTFLLGLLRARLRHARVSRLVVELGDLPAPERLEEALARALGDPSLKVGVWDPNAGTYVRANGKELALPAESSGLVATRLEREGRPLALVVHDEALLDDPGLVDATTAATRLAVENEQLQAEIRSQLDEVRASRERIVSAQDEERRRIERDLHDGAQQRLLRLSMALQVAESSLPSEPDPALRTSLQVAAEELHAGIEELRELARGIYPAVLTQRGLGAALRSLAETAAVPVEIISVPDGRLDPKIETAGYFVVTEALANVTKHAKASHATVAANVEEGLLTIEVTDDGVGGADVERGTGLSGLADRLHALDGELEIESGKRGTRLTAHIPLRHSLRPDEEVAVREDAPPTRQE